jgi:predicted TIM-barrel fold metal-dependent hydrolase
MLFARAITRIGRRLFADVIGTMYVAGEVDEVEEATVLDEEESRPPLISNIEAEIIDVKPKASISMDEALSAIAGVHGIENDAFLRQYIEDAMSKSKLMTLDALTKAWCENKDRFINAYNARKEKLEASKDEKITS